MRTPTSQRIDQEFGPGRITITYYYHQKDLHMALARMRECAMVHE